MASLHHTKVDEIRRLWCKHWDDKYPGVVVARLAGVSTTSARQHMPASIKVRLANKKRDKA